MADTRAIGVFDSGLGGLTVLSAIQRILPNESTVYLGDTARVPYGTKSPQTVIRYALNNARALLSFAPLKMLVVACNTVDSVAHEALQDALSIPVVGVIEPGARAALSRGNTRSVAVLATAGTVSSKAYEHALRKQGFTGEIYSQACPLFVPLVEEGLIAGPIAESVAKHYLQHLPKQVDSVILGCTHYPLLLPLLKNTLSTSPQWIDSGNEVALAVKNELEMRNLQAPSGEGVTRRYLVTDAPTRFEQLSEFYLGKPVSPRNVELVDVGAGS
jgi:glutamate racemase